MITKRFRYRAARSDGVIEQGVVAADSIAAASAALAARRTLPIEIAADEDGTSVALLSARDLALGLRLLATLLSSGLPLAKALSAFETVAPRGWSPGVNVLHDSIRQGHGLGTSLESSGLGLPVVASGLIRAGEAAGDLAGAIRSAAEIAEKNLEMRTALRNAFAYPLVLVVAAIATIALLLGFVVPRFALILAETGSVLPPSTRLLIVGTDALRASALPAIVVAALLVAGWRAWVRTPAGRIRWDALALAVPLLGGIRRAACTSRFCDALAVLLDAGVNPTAAVANAGSASGNAYIETQVLLARSQVLEGKSLSSALGAIEVLTSTSLLLLRAGEESGEVSTMLRHASRMEADRSAVLAKKCLGLVEPVLILFVGGFIALIAAALLQALYSARPL